MRRRGCGCRQGFWTDRRGGNRSKSFCRFVPYQICILGDTFKVSPNLSKKSAPGRLFHCQRRFGIARKRRITQCHQVNQIFPKEVQKAFDKNEKMCGKALKTRLIFRGRTNEEHGRSVERKTVIHNRSNGGAPGAVRKEPGQGFYPAALRHLYARRWGIETSSSIPWAWSTSIPSGLS